MSTIKVPKNAWENLSRDDHEKIKNIMIMNGLAKPADRLQPDDSIASISEDPAQVSGFICDALCDAAEAAAIAACSLLSGPAIPVCIIAAHEAGRICHDQC